MNTVIDSAFFQQLEKQITDTYSLEDAAQLVPFTKEILHLYPVEELVDKPINAVISLFYNFWQFMQKVDVSEPVVQVFDSGLENERGESKYTNIFVLYRDMPFLIDSILIELNNRGLNVSIIKNHIFNVIRDASGQITNAFVKESAEGVTRESGIFIQIDFRSSEEYHDELKQAITSVLGDVTAVTGD
jgi:glutamate dehydrogenase